MKFKTATEQPERVKPSDGRQVESKSSDLSPLTNVNVNRAVSNVTPALPPSEITYTSEASPSHISLLSASDAPVPAAPAAPFGAFPDTALAQPLVSTSSRGKTTAATTAVPSRAAPEFDSADAKAVLEEESAAGEAAQAANRPRISAHQRRALKQQQKRQVQQPPVRATGAAHTLSQPDASAGDENEPSTRQTSTSIAREEEEQQQLEEEQEEGMKARSDSLGVEVEQCSSSQEEDDESIATRSSITQSATALHKKQQQQQQQQQQLKRGQRVCFLT